MSFPLSKHFLIVNGVQFQKNLEPHPEFIARLEKAAAIIQDEKVDFVIVSGGLTKRGCLSEANFGEQYIKETIAGKKFQGSTKTLEVPIFKEEKSHTTIENIKFTETIFNTILKEHQITLDNVSKITLVTSSDRLPRLSYLYKKLWPEIQHKSVFVVAPHKQNPFLPFIEYLYLIYTKIDIEEKTLVHLSKRLFRNKKQ